MDLGLGLLLSRSERHWLAPRLAIDCFDITTSSATQGESYTGAAGLGVPLALEAGVRFGLGGLIVPATSLAITEAQRRRKGMSQKPGAHALQALAVFGGWAIDLYIRHEQAVARARHDESTAARCEQARLAGRNTVATTADTAVDILIRTAPILESPSLGRSTTQQMLSSWKAVLAAETDHHALYLKSGLDRWCRQHNETQPDLARDVEFVLPTGQWTVMLSKSQALELERILDGLGLRGTVSVVVTDLEHERRSGERLAMNIDDFEVEVPADQVTSPRSIDLGPTALWLAAVLSALPALPSEGDAPVLRVAPSVTWFLCAGAWAQRQTSRRGAEVHDSILVSCAVGSLLQALTESGALKHGTDANGLTRQTYLQPLFAELALAILYQRDVSRRTKVLVCTGVIFERHCGLRMNRSGVKDVAVSLVWPAAAFVTFRGLDRALEREMSAFVDALAGADADAISQAFNSGQSDVADLVVLACRETSQVA